MLGRRTAALAAIIATLLGACAPGAGTWGTLTTGTPVTQGREAEVVDDEQDEPEGLQIQLSNADGREPVASGDEPSRPILVTDPLTPARVAELLSRAPGLPSTPGRALSFAFPEPTLSPARPGDHVTETAEVLDATRPPPVVQSADPSVPLEVVRVTPSGETLGPVPTITVVFSAPMVPISSIDEVAAVDVPASLSPSVPGRWRWLGTTTLAFEADERLPMSSHVTLTVHADRATSVTGQHLADDVVRTVSTAAPRVRSVTPSPHRPTVRAPVIVVAFDQAVDDEAVLAKLSLEGSWFREWPLRLATDEELAEVTADDAPGHVRVHAWDAATMVAVRPAEPLPAGERVTVVVASGVPGDEGPRTSVDRHAQDLNVRGDLVVREVRCGWRRCVPGTPWQFRFSNPLVAQSFVAADVVIEPPVRVVDTQISGDTITIMADARGGTTYDVSFPAELGDVFGQSYGEQSAHEVSVGHHEQQLPYGWSMHVADPMAPPRHAVVSRNVDGFELVVLRVQADDWVTFNHVQRDLYHQRDGEYTLPGEVVFDARIDVDTPIDEQGVTHVDLAPYLDDGLGHVIVCTRALPEDRDVLEARASTDRTTGRRWRSVTWVQHTNLGLDVTHDEAGMTAWVTRLDTGVPVAGAEVAAAVAPGGVETTDSDGIARFGPVPDRQRSLALARSGADSVILDGLYGLVRGGSSARWVFVDDRPLYEPGQTVRIKGWVRRMDNGLGGDLTGVGDWVFDVTWKAVDARGVELAEGTVKPDDRGGFVASFDLPEGVNLGEARVTFTPRLLEGLMNRGNDATHTVRVEEFRRPEFEVAVGVTEGPHVLGDEAIATATGRYLSGGALPDADVTWRVSSSRASYAPPGWDRFSFGTWTPWWGWRGGWRGPQHDSSLTWQATTDQDGDHALALRFVSVTPPRSSSVSVEASIEDVNRQAWTGRSTFLVHPAEVYVGLRTNATYVNAGEPITGEVVVTDIDGGVAPGRPVEVVASLTSWRLHDGEWSEAEIARRELSITSADEPVPFDLRAGDDDETALGGRWTLTVSTTDADGRRNESQRTLWAAGGAPPVEATERLPFETVELVPDREDYEHGDVAEILVQAPFAPAHGVLTLLREGVVERRRIALDEPTTVLEIPIADAYVPNVHVHVELVGTAPRSAGSLDVSGIPLEPPPRPAYAQGELKLSVPPTRRALEIAVAPRDDVLLPGADTVLDLRVTGHDGAPVTDAEVAVVVVDEALYALTGATIPDPLGVLYPERPTDTRFHRGRASILLSPIRWDETSGEWRFASADDDDPDSIDEFEQRDMAVLESLGYADGVNASPVAAPAALSARGRKVASRGFFAAEAEVPAEPIAVRTNFDAVAAFVPDARTDADGNIAVPVTMPDSLTRYRIVAVALDPDRRAGKAEGSVSVRLPLMLRPSAPRFLSWGDACELPVVLQNGTGEALLVDVAAAASGVDLPGDTGLRVTVPANDRVEVRFDVATTDVGRAHFRFVAAAVDAPHADAATASFPVWTPATSETFAAVGVVDDGGVVQTVRMPRDVVTAFGGLEVSTSSTALASLSDAFLYLYHYSYGCTEQRASRLIGTLSMLDVVDAFTGLDGMPSREELLAQAADDVQALVDRQHGSGGFGWWTNHGPIQPYLSVHATSALLVAREHDVRVPNDALTRALDILDELPYDTEAERIIVSSYAASVLARAGRDEAVGLARNTLARARSLPDLPTDAVSWLLEAAAHARGGALDTEAVTLERELLNRVHESTSKAHVTTSSRVEDATVLLSSSKRSDAIATSALIAARPDSDAIVKLVRGLQGDRVKGRWATTQENVFVLRALRGYFDAYESEPPAFTAGTWLADRLAAEARFEGRNVVQHHVEIPLATVASLASPNLDDPDGATQDLPLVIAKDGRGRMYWRASLRTAPADLALDAADAGFTVTRTYEAVDDPDDVRRDADGTWRVKAGATVRVTITMTTPMVRHHVALVDPLPGGFEPVNPSLAASPSTADALEPDASTPWWRRVWYGHQNLRDERAEAFTTWLMPGAHSYRYVARATTPGRYVAGPSKAEEMYEPETFGRGATDVVVVEPGDR